VRACTRMKCPLRYRKCQEEGKSDALSCEGVAQVKHFSGSPQDEILKAHELLKIQHIGGKMQGLGHPSCGEE